MKEQEFFEKMATVWLELDALNEAAQAIAQEMTDLQRAGMTNATIHIRSDNGAMELLHRTGSDYEQANGRRREYIGKKPEAQEEARYRVRRWEQYKKLISEWQRKKARITEIQRQIERLEMIALGKQAKLFSEMGTAGSSGQKIGVPKDWKWLTPKMVIDHFNQSEDLAAMADDVEDVLGKTKRAESKKLAA